MSLISHKLRTPLTGTLGFLELLEADHANLSEFQRRALARARAQGEKLHELVEKLILFSAALRLDGSPLRLEEVHVQEVVDDALDQTAFTAARRRARLWWDRPSLTHLPRLTADPHLLREAIAHLLDNAIKFNQAQRPGVWIEGTHAEDGITLAVRDDGPGIDPREQPNMFRRFYQIEEGFTGQTPGWGLGLAFVKSVADAHGGAVLMRSAPGAGSVFSLRLPLHGPAAPAPANPSPA